MVAHSKGASEEGRREEGNVGSKRKQQGTRRCPGTSSVARIMSTVAKGQPPAAWGLQQKTATTVTPHPAERDRGRDTQLLPPLPSGLLPGPPCAKPSGMSEGKGARLGKAMGLTPGPQSRRDKDLQGKQKASSTVTAPRGSRNDFKFVSVRTSQAIRAFWKCPHYHPRWHLGC